MYGQASRIHALEAELEAAYTSLKGLEGDADRNQVVQALKQNKASQFMGPNSPF